MNQASLQRSKRLIVLSHGLTGRPREFIHVMAKRAFNAAGYDVARVAYYSGEENARTLRECTLEIQAKDLNTTLDHFRAHYPEIFIAGHSYGGLTLLIANPKATAVSFWDSTWTPGWTEEVASIPELNSFAFNNGQESLIGRAMFDEALEYAAHPPLELAKQFKAPAQVILAGQDAKPGRGRIELFNALSGVKELQIVKDADHQFTEGSSVEELIEHTLAWFRKCGGC